MLIYIIPSFYRSRLRKEECIFIFEQAKALSKIEGNKVIVLSVHPISIKHNIFSNLKIKNDLNDNVVTHYKKIILCYHPQKNRKRYVKEFYNALEKMMKLAIKKQ